MNPVYFEKFSPSGNSTLFLRTVSTPEVPRLCREALDIVPAEQAGLACPESGRLQMAGGEFCANACRAFGALLDMKSGEAARVNVRHYQMTISGLARPVELEVAGSEPQWTAAAIFDFEPFPLLKIRKKVHLARLPGISHLLIQSDILPRPEEAFNAAAKLRDTHSLNETAAAGVVWWRQRGDSFEILPVVRVAELDLCVAESSCGSASIALARLAQSAGISCPARILQPSGEFLEICLSGSRVRLGGSVRLEASGKLWLNTRREEAK